MPLLCTALTLLAALAPAAPQAPGAGAEDAYPLSTALAEGVSPDALAALDALVRSFVDAGEVVGAELQVIVHGRTILHAGYGWRDRENERPMQPGGVFCVRSMTKPVIGAAIRMLIEDRLLTPQTRVAEHLPAFQNPEHEGISVEQLLTHTSGLPMSQILAADPRELTSLRAVADLGGAAALEFPPGSDFHYSDQGTDTLTALIEVVSGRPAEDFVRERVLEPLGMHASACLMSAGHALREQGCCKYVGSPGRWTRFWGPDEEALFAVFLGSQGLYSTTRDYARFLELWLRRGRLDGQRLLRPASVRRTLEPGPHPLVGPTGFPGLHTAYGSLMQLWLDEAGEVVVFGHTGSDGTHAWAFPEAQAMVLYFTQSRGTTTGLRVEEQLGELFLGVPFDALQAAPPLEEYLGYYREDEGDLYRAIVRDEGGLALEILGKAVVPLGYVGEDRWKLLPQPGTVLAFERDGAGRVSGYHIGEHHELRFEPSPELPTAAEICARVAAAHRIDRLEAAGPVRMRSTLTIEKLGLQGESLTWLEWPDRWRADEVLGEEVGSTAFDGETLWLVSSAHPRGPLEGQMAELLRGRSPFERFGDWMQHYDEVQVVQRITKEGEDALIVRLGDTSAPAATVYVDAASGRVGRVDSMTFIESLGRIGQRVSFGEYGDVGGATLPFRVNVELAHPLIGSIVTVVEEVELGVRLPAGHFELRADG